MKNVQVFRNISPLKAGAFGAAVSLLTSFLQIVIFTAFINYEYISIESLGVFRFLVPLVSGCVGGMLAQFLLQNGRLNGVLVMSGMVMLVHICAGLALNDHGIIGVLVPILAILAGGLCSLLLCNITRKTGFNCKIRMQNKAYCTKSTNR